MREVSQAEAIENLPILIQEARTHSVRIADEGGEDVFLVSAREYERLRKAAIAEMREISERAGARVAAHAAELGISVDELVADLLSDE